jgi:hypothetical protein
MSLFPLFLTVVHLWGGVWLHDRSFQLLVSPTKVHTYIPPNRLSGEVQRPKCYQCLSCLLKKSVPECHSVFFFLSSPSHRWLVKNFVLRHSSCHTSVDVTHIVLFKYHCTYCICFSRFGGILLNWVSLTPWSSWLWFRCEKLILFTCFWSLWREVEGTYMHLLVVSWHTNHSCDTSICMSNAYGLLLDFSLAPWSSLCCVSM